jgi:hypothetical protein
VTDAASPRATRRVLTRTPPCAPQIALASIADVAPGGYVSYCRLDEPTAPFASTDEYLLLEHDLWEEMAQEWVKVAPEVKEVLA